MTRSAIGLALLAASLLLPARAAEMPSRVLEGSPPAAERLRAPHVAPRQAIALPAALEKQAQAAERPGGPLRVGTVRALAKAERVSEWVAVPGGYVAALSAASPEAAGIRVRLDLSANAAPMELRVVGDDGRVERMVLDPARTGETWGPWTSGDSQRLEVFSVERPAEGAVRVGAVLHFTTSPFAKAAGACTVPTMCSTDDPALDAAIAQRKKSIMRINYVERGSSFVCSATLINTPSFPSAYVLTANHCVDNAQAAATISSWWFYETTSCDAASAVNPDYVQVPGGMQLVFGNYNVDSSLLLMNGAPPAGAVYAGWNSTRLVNGNAVVSLSHPTGDTSRLALGAVTREYGIVGRPQPMTGVSFTRGIIQQGSSGSGLFSTASGELRLRAILSGSTVRNGPMSCTNTGEEGLYGRFDIFFSQIAQYIGSASQAADDAPNRPQELFDAPLDPAGTDMPLDQRGAALALDNRRIDYAGDVDVYRFVLSAPAVVSAWTEGPNRDTVGTLLDSRGSALDSDDDAQSSDNHFGITRQLAAGTYYVQVAHFEVGGTGPYNLRLRADLVESTNRTALWWNASEPGWGMNINHQGNILFATLFTYDAAGAPMWLVMSRGERGSDGAYSGTLYRTTGPAFNAASWGAVTLNPVGTMRISFLSAGVGSVTYTFNGTQVSKTIMRQQIAAAPVATCTWSAFDRSYDDNFQDLWWNPAENGWGVNLTHQGDIIFATLFTYDAGGRGLWLVMSRGDRTGTGTYSGALYRMAGPPFNASPWPGATPTQVGTMTLNFTSGHRGTITYSVDGVQVTKPIERQVFGAVRPSCS